MKIVNFIRYIRFGSTGGLRGLVVGFADPKDAEFEIFFTKDQLAEMMESYSKLLELGFTPTEERVQELTKELNRKSKELNSKPNSE